MTRIIKILEEKLFNNGEFSHHAFILGGEQDKNHDALLNFLENKKIFAPNQTNLIYIEIDKVLLENAKLLREQVSLKTVSGFKKIFILKFSKINREAENALLKTFEEPPEETLFFLITKNHHLLLPTTLSRFQLIDIQKDQDNPDKKENQKKSKKTDGGLIKDKLLEIEKLTKKFKDKNISIMDLNDFLIRHEKIIRQNGLNQKNIKSLKKIAELRRYLLGPSPNTKIILETAVMLANDILFKN